MAKCWQCGKHTEAEDKQGKVRFTSPSSPWLCSKSRRSLIKWPCGWHLPHSKLLSIFGFANDTQMSLNKLSFSLYNPALLHFITSSERGTLTVNLDGYTGELASRALILSKSIFNDRLLNWYKKILQELPCAMFITYLCFFPLIFTFPVWNCERWTTFLRDKIYDPTNTSHLS